jgi:exodeoxyribonuclease III
MALTLTTWNINSVRLRIDNIARLVRTVSPDILCLQEIKVQDLDFPFKPLKKLGYEHTAVVGQKGYHGVAILSRVPLEASERLNWCGKEDARHVRVRLKGGIDLHNFYVPAGGDIPDPKENEKFAHKLDFIDAMAKHFRAAKRTGTPSILVGDLNVAPLEHDVWSHKQLLKVVSHTPVEVEKFTKLQASLGWVDVMREFVPRENKLYTWWSYRAKDWETSDRGRRLDHIWATPDLAPQFKDLAILKEARGWDKASDHVPVTVTLDI